MYRKDAFNRILNPRPWLLAAISLAVGIGFAYAALYCGVPLYTAFFTPLPLLLCLLVEREKWRALARFFLVLLCVGIGAGSFTLRMTEYEKRAFADGEYRLIGEVKEAEETENGLVLTLIQVQADGARLDGNVRLEVYGQGLSAETGLIVEGNAELRSASSPYAYHRFSVRYPEENIRYTAVARSSFVLRGQKVRFLPAVRSRIQSVCEAGMGEEGGVAYALTTGNTSMMEEGLLTSVRYGGIAHLFAVSGLHIGVVYALLSLTVKKLRSPRVRWIASVGVLGVLALFCGVCAFSPSSLRALCICLANEVCALTMRRGDGLEKVGFAGTLLLLIDPVWLFSAGFRLSMSAYFGLIALQPTVLHALKTLFPRTAATKFGGKFCNIVAGMVSVQLGSFPVLLATFGYVSAAGLLLNLFLLPLFSLYFPILLGSVALACLVPVAAEGILFLPAGVLSLFVKIFTAVDFGKFLLCGFAVSLSSALAYFLFLWICGGRLRLPRSMALPVCTLLLTAFFCSSAVHSGAGKDCRIQTVCSYNAFCACTVRTDGCNVLLVGGQPSVSLLQTFAFRQGGAFDAVVVADGAVRYLPALRVLSFGTLYVPYDDPVSLQTHAVVKGRAFSIGGVDYCMDGDGSIRIQVQGVRGLFNGYAEGYDFSLFSSEGCDGLLFTVESGILNRQRA